VQSKLAPKSPLARRLHQWAIDRGFPLLVRIAPRLPRWLAFAAARAVIAVVMAVYPGPKREIERNMGRILGRRIPGERASEREVRRARRLMLRNFAYYWTDLFRFCQLPFERTRELLARVEGQEHFEAALASRRGVILLTAHLGNWELGAAFMQERRLPLSVVYVRDQFATAEAVRALLRGRIAVDEIPIDPRAELSSLPVLRALKAGRIVSLQGDRDFNERGEVVEFFGAPAPFPRGPMLLARMTGAVLLPVFIVYDPRYRLEVYFRQPIEVEAGTGDRAGAARRALERWVAVLEEAVARWPTQWYTFYHPWDDAAAVAEAPEVSAAPEREAV